MPRVHLKQGEFIEISPDDSDGVITVSYNKSEGAGSENECLTIHVDLPDNTFNREGVIYREEFGVVEAGEVEAGEKDQ